MSNTAIDYGTLFEESPTEPQTPQNNAPHATPAANPIQILPPAQNAAQRTLAPLNDDRAKRTIELAKKIIDDYRQKREAASGIMKQLEIYADQGQDPALMLVCAAEALDRLSGGGDQFIKRIIASLESNGYTIGEPKPC